MPKISPRLSANETSSTTLRPGLVTSQQLILRASNITSPMSWGSRGKRFFISRPTIIVMISGVVSSDIGRVAICAPSRITVTVSEISATSSSL
ncbi:hypothetical protein DK59_3128 [Brucella abortus bv. 4 str. 292]|nr:hypothetical protein DK59_3128 [Brucella abortus bv. 4 str. 292]